MKRSASGSISEMTYLHHPMEVEVGIYTIFKAKKQKKTGKSKKKGFFDIITNYTTLA